MPWYYRVTQVKSTRSGVAFVVHFFPWVTTRERTYFVSVLSIRRKVKANGVGVLGNTSPRTKHLFSVRHTVSTIVVGSCGFSKGSVTSGFHIGHVGNEHLQAGCVATFYLTRHRQAVTRKVPRSMGYLVNAHRGNVYTTSFVRSTLSPILRRNYSYVNGRFSGSLHVRNNLRDESTLGRSISRGFYVRRVPIINGDREPFHTFRLRQLSVTQGKESHYTMPRVASTCRTFLFEGFTRSFHSGARTTRYFRHVPITSDCSHAFLATILREGGPMVYFGDDEPISIVSNGGPTFFVGLIVTNDRVPIVRFRGFSPIEDS